MRYGWMSKVYLSQELQTARVGEDKSFKIRLNKTVFEHTLSWWLTEINVCNLLKLSRIKRQIRIFKVTFRMMNPTGITNLPADVAHSIKP